MSSFGSWTSHNILLRTIGFKMATISVKGSTAVRARESNGGVFTRDTTTIIWAPFFFKSNISMNANTRLIINFFQLLHREFRTNEVLDWNQDQSIVTYMPNRTYIFDEATSCAGCDDQVDSFVTVNIPLLVCFNLFRLL